MSTAYTPLNLRLVRQMLQVVDKATAQLEELEACFGDLEHAIVAAESGNAVPAVLEFIDVARRSFMTVLHRVL